MQHSRNGSDQTEGLGRVVIFHRVAWDVHSERQPWRGLRRIGNIECRHLGRSRLGLFKKQKAEGAGSQ